jgi:hypothetical protein
MPGLIHGGIEILLLFERRKDVAFWPESRTAAGHLL